MKQEIWLPTALGTIILHALCGCTRPATMTPLTRENSDWTQAELIWNEEFDGDRTDTSSWRFETGGGGWGNKELQHYTNGANVEVSGGALKITARKFGESYTSCRLKSIPSWTFGRFEVRAKMPNCHGNGVWPAIWMLGREIEHVGWPKCGEIDIVEYLSSSPGLIYQSLHTQANNHTAEKEANQEIAASTPVPSVEDEFHIYGVLWDRQSVSLYVDDIDNVRVRFDRHPGATKRNWPFNAPFQIVMNVAVGGSWAGKHGVDDAAFPATMEVDYVRVYQLP